VKKQVDALVIGAGSAGLAAAVALKQAGIDRMLVIDREEYAGGILLQCIHNGFGLHTFNQELTGPEYAQKYEDMAAENQIEILLGSSAIDIMDNGDTKTVMILSEELGLLEVETRVIILAMGCRERNRGNINIPGSRPAGVLTAGLAQRLINIEGYMPGREVVIVGSGDIGLIMARRMTLEGAKVKAVLEIQPYPGGLERNIVQCLNDFDIPLYTSHILTNISGRRRVESVDVSEIKADGSVEHRMTIDCDTVLLSVGLVPENELSMTAGVRIHNVTGGAIVDGNLMTSVPGVFACGNVLHVHDLVDYVSEESAYCGRCAAGYIKGQLAAADDVAVHPGNMIRYIMPMTVKAGAENLLRMRPVASAKNVVLKIHADGKECFSKKFSRVTPSEMIVAKIDVPAGARTVTAVLEV
jgi:NADPH-dependent 2,4-dienoyl-CoA reductase/sulfur reductase-like enzyme